MYEWGWVSDIGLFTLRGLWIGSKFGEGWWGVTLRSLDVFSSLPLNTENLTTLTYDLCISWDVTLESLSYSEILEVGLRMTD